MILYSYNVSPYAAKIRAILRYKGLPFEERVVHPLHRGELARRSGQQFVPVIDDGGRVIADSTHIARYLDEKYPEKPILPRDPALRGRALLLEEWADEGLPRVVQPVRWFLPANAARTIALMRSAYPAGRAEDLTWVGVGAFLKLDMRRKYGERFGAPSPAKILNRLAEVVAYLDDALAETGWLAGPEPSVADFAAWGFLHFLEELDGWETVKAKKRVVKLIRAFAPEKTAAPEAYDSDDAAMLDASHHRRSQPAAPGKKRLPLA